MGGPVVGIECLTRKVCPLRLLVDEKMSPNSVSRLTRSVLSVDGRYEKSKSSNVGICKVLFDSSTDTKKMFCSGVTIPNLYP